MNRRFVVYVVQNSKNKLYIGMSEDVLRRVDQHNLGKSTWTKSRGPWRLVWQSSKLSYSQARKLENRLKKQKGGDGFYEMTGLSRSIVNPAAAGS